MADKGFESLRVAVLGASGIGKHHARIYHALGAEVVAILGSSPASSEATAAALKKDYGLRAEAFHRFEDLPADLDAVSICTPHPLHLEQTLGSFDRGLAVLCEKPLFWSPETTKDSLERGLRDLREHASRRLWLHIDKSVFADAFPKNVSRFEFLFDTAGPHRGREIGVDLLPHAFSILTRAFGSRAISSSETEAEELAYRCRFDYGGIDVRFDLREGGNQKRFEFTLDGEPYTRVAGEKDGVYRVGLRRPDGTLFEMRDPFETRIAEFLEGCRDEKSEDGFAEAETNLRLMSELLL